jgi:hypothetical protein
MSGEIGDDIDSPEFDDYDIGGDDDDEPFRPYRGRMPLAPMRLVAAANALVGIGEERGDSRSESRGAFVDLILGEMHCAPQREPQSERVPWDTAFVGHVGYWSHFDQCTEKSFWPLPPTPRVEELAQYASICGAMRTVPLEGDVYLLWSPARKEFVRSGIIVTIEHIERLSDGSMGYRCVTIDGDSDAIAAAVGTKVLRSDRVLSAAAGDRFIRWTAMDGRDENQEAINIAVDASSLREAA